MSDNLPHRKWSLLFLFFRIFENSVSLFSFSAISRFGSFLGIFLFHVVRIRRRTVFKNLQTALPDRKDEHYNIARQSYAATGMNILEFFYMSRASFKEIDNCMTVTGWDNYTGAMSKGRGVIVVTGHFGNFDLLACSQRLKDVPLAILSKNLSSTGINNEWMRIRKRFGLKIFASNEAKAVLSWLKSGKVLGLVVDQRIGSSSGGIPVPFFSKQVWTSPAAVKLAAHSGAVLLPVVSRRISHGRHIMQIESPMDVCFDSGGSVDIARTMLHINRKIEQWIVEYPDNWMWMHRRFKNSISAGPGKD